MVPELDANRARKWAADRTAADLRDEMRVEVDETPRGLTILECRPPWSDLMGSEWTRSPIARLRHSKQSGEWTLYYADRNDRFHRYWECDPSEQVADLLEEIDNDPTCIFWGLIRSTGTVDVTPPIAGLVAQMIGTLDLQAPFQGRFQHPFQQTLMPGERLAGIDTSEDLIKRAGLAQRLRDLGLLATTLLALRISFGHGHSVLRLRSTPTPLTQSI